MYRLWSRWSERCGKKVIKSRKLKGNYSVEKRKMRYSILYSSLCSLLSLRVLSIKRYRAEREEKRKILGSFWRNDYILISRTKERLRWKWSGNRPDTIIRRNNKDEKREYQHKTAATVELTSGFCRHGGSVVSRRTRGEYTSLSLRLWPQLVTEHIRTNCRHARCFVKSHKGQISEI